MSLVFLLKITPLHRAFMDTGAPKKILKFMLTSTDDMQVCYNGMVILWLLSFKHQFMGFIEDRKNEVFEIVKKVLQMFRREKIVRVASMFFLNVLSNEKCIEIMIDCDIFKEISNLLNWQWQD